MLLVHGGLGGSYVGIVSFQSLWHQAVSLSTLDYCAYFLIGKRSKRKYRFFCALLTPYSLALERKKGNAICGESLTDGSLRANIYIYWYRFFSPLLFKEQHNLGLVINIEEAGPMEHVACAQWPHVLRSPSFYFIFSPLFLLKREGKSLRKTSSCRLLLQRQEKTRDFYVLSFLKAEQAGFSPSRVCLTSSRPSEFPLSFSLNSSSFRWRSAAHISWDEPAENCRPSVWRRRRRSGTHRALHY